MFLVLNTKFRFNPIVFDLFISMINIQPVPRPCPTKQTLLSSDKDSSMPLLAISWQPLSPSRTKAAQTSERFSAYARLPLARRPLAAPQGMQIKAINFYLLWLAAVQSWFMDHENSRKKSFSSRAFMSHRLLQSQPITPFLHQSLEGVVFAREKRLAWTATYTFDSCDPKNTAHLNYGPLMMRDMTNCFQDCFPCHYLSPTLPPPSVSAHKSEWCVGFQRTICIIPGKWGVNYVNGIFISGPGQAQEI